MATIYYEILNGEAPFIAELRDNAPPYSTIATSTGIGIGEHYFTEVPDGDYIVVITDVNGCVDYFTAEIFCPTTTTTTTCPPTDCGCIPEFDTYVTPSIAVIDVGVLVGCAYEDYVIDWYDDQNNIVLTTGKTFAHNSIPGHSLPNVEVIHPLTGTSTVYIEAGIYTARIRYVVIGGLTYYPDSPIGEPCRLYCTGLNIDIAIIEVTSLPCGEINTTDPYYDYETSYTPTGGISYKTFSYFTIELAHDENSGYLAIYMKPELVNDIVWVYWGPAEDDDLIDMYKCGAGLTASSEGTYPYPVGSEKTLAGDERKVVISFIDRTYTAGQILTVKIESNVNTNTKWLYRFKCLDKTEFPEITNYFPLSLRNTTITNLSVTRTVNCLYTLKFTLPNAIVDPSLFSTNFYNYNTIDRDNNQGFNYSTGEFTMTFNKGDWLQHGGYWGMTSTPYYVNLSHQIDESGVSGASCNTSFVPGCKGFHYKWDHIKKSLKFTVNPNDFESNSEFYYGLKNRYLSIMQLARIGYNGTAKYTEDENMPGHYHGILILWLDSVLDIEDKDRPCGDVFGGNYNFYFHHSCIVEIMGIPINPSTDPLISSFNANGTLKASVVSAITALEKIGGVEQVKTIEFFAADPGGLGYTTTTTTTDEFGMGSCNTISYTLYSGVIRGGMVNAMRNTYNLIGSTGGNTTPPTIPAKPFNTTWEGRSICCHYSYAQWIMTREFYNDEIVKTSKPIYRMLLKSLADRTCNSLDGWWHTTNNVDSPIWEYLFYIANLKVTFYDGNNFTIESFLNQTTGEIEGTSTIIYPTTTSSTTLP